MTDIAISVENLSKSYLVGHNAAQSERYTALRDVLYRNARNLARKTRDMFSGRAIVQGDEVEEFWALKDVSFEIMRGDRVGIIGRNGAGKSTLLKILSRITEPTTGRIKIAGRVASLLEVGTGFHPELTGRENIFLNAAILGMSRSETKNRFDEIVDFAGVEKFLDTPVKRYSSGMYVRLAFAIAAHLESEILIVDEVLAVGDAVFQKKCLGKMEEVSNDGRTVIFVSHNMSAMDTLCSSAIFLQSGKILSSGPVQDQIERYIVSTMANKNSKGSSEKALSNEIYLQNFEFLPDVIPSGDSAKFFLRLRMQSSVRINDIAILFYTSSQERAAIIDLRDSLSNKYNFDASEILEIKGEITSIPFVEGIYSVGLYLGGHVVARNHLDITKLTVIPQRKKISTIVPYPAASRGIISLNYHINS